MIALSAALVAAAHAYVLPWGVLFLLPSNRESACAIGSIHYGPPDGKWERAAALEKRASCEVRQFVVPGPLLPDWTEHVDLADVSVAYTVQGSEEPQTLSLHAQTVDPAELTAGGVRLSATVEKVKGRVRSVVTSNSDHPVLLGDVIAKINKPPDACSATGASVILQRGESLVDIREGLLSPSMAAWVAAFSDAKHCTWVKAATRHK
jgi:hypothetical protein